MAILDKKITELPALVIPATPDELYIVDDVAGTATQKSITAGTLLNRNLTLAETSAGLTETNIDVRFDIGDVRRYGAIGDGVTNQTTALQTALDVAGSHVIFFPPGTYLTDQIEINGKTDVLVIGYGATIRWENQASTRESFTIEGICKNITIEGLKFKGDDRPSEPFPQIGVHVRPVATTDLDGLRVINCWFENLTMGVATLAETDGVIKDIYVSGCHFTEMAGTEGGMGYGVHTNFGNTIGLARVVDNFFEKCHRHSIYLSRPRSGSVVSGNTVYKHRDGDPDEDKGAIVVDRGQGVVIDGNTIRESADTGIRINADITVTQDDTENIVVSNNLITHGDAVDIGIGGGDPLNQGALRNVLVSGNVIDRDDGTNFENSIEMRQGIGVTITGNTFWASNNYASLYSLVKIIGAGETRGVHDGSDNASVFVDSSLSLTVNELIGVTIFNLTDGSSTTVTANTATTITGTLAGGTDNDWDIGDVLATSEFTDDLTISNNIFNGSGTNFRPIRLDNEIADTNAKMVFSSNVFNISGAGSRPFHIPQGTHVNRNIEVIGQSAEGLVLTADRTKGSVLPVFTASDTSPSIRGSNVWLTNSGALTINDFDDGEKGQELTVISNGAIIFDTTGTNLNGSSVDLVTANDDVTTWINETGTQWRLKNFLNASVDNSVVASQEIVTATNIITAAENGRIFYLDTAGGFTSTLPAPAIGLSYKFIVSTAPTTAYIITTNSGANLLFGFFLDIVGEQVYFSAQDTLNFVASTSVVGDFLEVESDGTNWYCTAKSGADGGITVAVT